MFCAGLGTTGTILGVGDYLKRKSRKITVVGVVRSPNNPVPGVRTQNLLHEIAFDWRKITDHIEEIGTKESFGESLKLCWAGLMVGPNSGLALAGLISFLLKQKNFGKLDSLRNEEGEVLTVFICPDSPLPYLDKYFEYFDEFVFSKIENEHLLINKTERKKEAQIQLQNYTDLEIEPAKANKIIYSYSQKDLWNLINKNKSVSISDNIELVDVRIPEEYWHNHLPCSVNIYHNEVLQNISNLSNQWKHKKVITVCHSSRRSIFIAEALRQNGIEAFSIQAGMIEWSRLNLPRRRSKICKI